jgi:hypothetical protein
MILLKKGNFALSLEHLLYPKRLQNQGLSIVFEGKDSGSL